MLLGAWPIGGQTSPNQSPKRGVLRLIFLIFGYILFLILGAAIFSAIEAPNIDNSSKKLNLYRTKFLKRNKCVDGKYIITNLLEN